MNYFKNMTRRDFFEITGKTTLPAAAVSMT